MELVTPSIGLIFWSSISFLLLALVLGKFAWKPILGAVREREESIKHALESAERAKNDMAALTASNEQLLKETYLERDNMLKKAKEMSDAIVTESKNKAKEEGERIIAQAKAAINTEKQAALVELKNHVAELSIAVAEKIVREHLSKNENQKALAETLVKEASLN